MKKYFYYGRQRHRKTDNVPVVTYCLINNDGIVAKGVAVCSEKDNPDKRLGRKIALGRALKALNDDYSKMNKDGTFWKQLSHDMVFSYLTDVDRKILKVDELSKQ